MKEVTISDHEFAEYLEKHKWPGLDAVIKYGKTSTMFFDDSNKPIAYVQYDNVKSTRRIWLPEENQS